MNEHPVIARHRSLPPPLTALLVKHTLCLKIFGARGMLVLVSMRPAVIEV
jgi:hypothetical protein